MAGGRGERLPCTDQRGLRRRQVARGIEAGLEPRQLGGQDALVGPGPVGGRAHGVHVMRIRWLRKTGGSAS